MDIQRTTGEFGRKGEYLVIDWEGIKTLLGDNLFSGKANCSNPEIEISKEDECFIMKATCQHGCTALYRFSPEEGELIDTLELVSIEIHNISLRAYENN